MIRVSLSNTNEIALQGTKQPLFNHVTKMVHGSEPVNTIRAVPFTLSKSVSNVGHIHETLCACVRMFSMVISRFHLFFADFRAWNMKLLFLILLEFFKPFNKLADRVLSDIKALATLGLLYLIKHSCSFIKQY